MMNKLIKINDRFKITKINSDAPICKAFGYVDSDKKFVSSDRSKAFTPHIRRISILPKPLFNLSNKVFSEINVVWAKLRNALASQSFLCGGFTIIEMLVIIGILSLLSATLILYNRTGERQIILFKEQARVIGIISRAKSFSIATFGQPGVPCGYGVHFSAPRTFMIFKDLADDCQLADKIYSNSAEIVESFELDSIILFENLTLTDIIFIPPDPSVFITPLQDQATIIIKTTDGNSSVIIKVNNAGQIST